MIEIFVILVIVLIVVVPVFFGLLCAAIGLCYIIGCATTKTMDYMENRLREYYAQAIKNREEKRKSKGKIDKWHT